MSAASFSNPPSAAAPRTAQSDGSAAVEIESLEEAGHPSNAALPENQTFLPPLPLSEAFAALLEAEHGASGAPVIDCAGRAVAVVSTIITQTISLPTGAVRVSTAWQTPNVVSIPAEALKGFSWSE